MEESFESVTNTVIQVSGREWKNKTSTTALSDAVVMPTEADGVSHR
ncbi:MAG: hypothetical protein NT077_00295 [Candidatus Taylorbacteria bacterium]|nr:hypothetical protein [Candidatus Taylorbacteria bacterium]